MLTSFNGKRCGLIELNDSLCFDVPFNEITSIQIQILVNCCLQRACAYDLLHLLYLLNSHMQDISNPDRFYFVHWNRIV